MLIVDRIEAGVAICEQDDRTMLTIPLAALPDGVHEGDCLIPQGGGYIVDDAATVQRRGQAASRQRSLLKKKNK